MRRFLILLGAVLLLVACNREQKSRPLFSLNGAWTLQQAESPEGHLFTFSPVSETYLRIYNGDSAVYEYSYTQTAEALVVAPEGKTTVTLIDKGGGEHLYLEGEDPRPLTVVDDTTIVIQQMGTRYTWHRADNIVEEWGDEIRQIIDKDMSADRSNAVFHSYVFSAKERRQAGVIHVLLISIFSFIILVVLITLFAIANRRAKRRLQLQLQQIHEEHDARPQPVRQAIESVESEYFASDEYLSLQHRIATGQRLKTDDWNKIEAQLKKVYPGFSSQLRNLHPMSELEYQTCLLIKLRIAPTDIASVLSRDVSTISTVRSRLYKKVFGQKGGAREWDEFVLSIGA